MKSKVLVVDLDQTLFSINTFHHFLMYLLKVSFIKIKPVVFLNVAALIMLRALRIISHSKLKYYILKVVNNNTFFNCHDFVDEIEVFKRNILEINNTVYNYKVLSTAAPKDYAEIIASRCGFDACIATIFSNRAYASDFENSKSNKLKHTIEFLEKKGINGMITLITDHLDDLPLMKVSEKTILINPDKKLKDQLNQLSINYSVEYYES